jgi:hypothetical protein
MNSILKLISFVGLLMTVVPSFLVFSGVILLDTHKWLMLLGTIIWFVSAPFWISKKTRS